MTTAPDNSDNAGEIARLAAMSQRNPGFPSIGHSGSGEVPPSDSPLPGAIKTALTGARREVSPAGFQTFEAPQPLAELESFTLVVPLLDEAKALVGKDVVVWIPGGMQADGTLTEVDEEQQTLVVIDGRRRYAIALQSIALIESAR